MASAAEALKVVNKARNKAKKIVLENHQDEVDALVEAEVASLGYRKVQKTVWVSDNNSESA